MSRGAWSLVLLVIGFTKSEIVKETPEFSAEGKEIMNMIFKTCLKRSGANANDVMQCEQGVFPDDPKLKAHTFCIFQEIAVADEKGVIDFELMVMLMPERYRERMKGMFFPCRDLDVSKYDKFDSVYEICKCAFKNDPAFYFVVK